MSEDMEGLPFYMLRLICQFMYEYNTCYTWRTDCCCFHTMGRSMSLQHCLRSRRSLVCSTQPLSRSWSESIERTFYQQHKPRNFRATQKPIPMEILFVNCVLSKHGVPQSSTIKLLPFFCYMREFWAAVPVEGSVCFYADDANITTFSKNPEDVTLIVHKSLSS